MLVDSLMLSAVLQEINNLSIGSVVRAVQTVVPMEVALLVQHKDKSKTWLIASAHTRYAHIGWAEQIPHRGRDWMRGGDADTQRFAEGLERWLKRARFIGAEQIDFDRLVVLRFVNLTPLGEQKRYALWCEIMGKHSNLVFVDDETGIILDALKRLSASVNRYREVLPNKPYVRPPTGERGNPLIVTRDEWATIVGAIHESPLKGLARTFFGMSDWLLALLNERLEGATDAEALWEGLVWLHETVRQGKFIPTVWRDADGKIARCYPLPMKAWGDGEPIPHFGPALTEWLHEQMRHELTEKRRQSLLAAIQRAIAGLDEQLRELRERWQEAQDANRYRRFGELLLTFAHAIPDGAAEAEVTDYDTNPPQKVCIPLPKDKSPTQAAQHYFTLYRKLRSAAEALPAVMERLQRQRDEWAQFERRVQMAGDGELDKLFDEAKVKGLWREQVRSSTVDGASDEFLRFTVAGGYEVWVGRNAEANLKLLRVARPDDVWFHVKGAPGSHALLRVQKRGEQLPLIAIEQAAQIAAHFSKRRTSSWVEVDYTKARYVRPVKGQKGLALYTHFKTVAVEPKLATGEPEIRAEINEPLK